MRFSEIRLMAMQFRWLTTDCSNLSFGCVTHKAYRWVSFSSFGVPKEKEHVWWVSTVRDSVFPKPVDYKWKWKSLECEGTYQVSATFWSRLSRWLGTNATSGRLSGDKLTKLFSRTSSPEKAENIHAGRRGCFCCSKHHPPCDFEMTATASSGAG